MTRINTNVSSLTAQKTLSAVQRISPAGSYAAEHRLAGLAPARTIRPADRQRNASGQHRFDQSGDHQQRTG